MTMSSGGSTKVPSVIALPASTMMPSVHTSASSTEMIGSTTPRTLQNDSHSTSSTSAKAIGVKRRRSRRIMSTAACFRCPAPV
jgi:hypothetical protein